MEKEQPPVKYDMLEIKLILSKNIICMVLMFINSLAWSCHTNFTKAWHIFHYLVACSFILVIQPIYLGIENQKPRLVYSLITQLFLQYQLAINFGLIPILQTSIVILTATDCAWRFLEILKLDAVMFLTDWNFYWQLILVPLIICLTFGVLNGHF